jgi:hypothetical protein
VYEGVINRLKLDFAGCYHLVNQVTIDIDFSIKFALNFFNLFTKLSSVKILSSNSYDLKNLIRILYSLEYLKHITLSSKFIRFNPLLNSGYHKFLYRLKSIKLTGPSSFANEKLPFDIINSNFANLECLTLVNNRILSKISNGLSSLLYVEFSQDYHYEKTRLNEFISNNPQLKQISIPEISLDGDIINSIISLKNLYKLEIFSSGNLENSFNIHTENYSIKHFIYDHYWCIQDNTRIFDILKMCKSLEIYQTSNIAFTDIYKMYGYPKVKTLVLKNISDFNSKGVLFILSKFSQVKFRNGCKFGDIADQLQKYNNIKWKPNLDYSRDTDEFTLVKRL